jgi:hypothetical protein
LTVKWPSANWVNGGVRGGEPERACSKYGRFSGHRYWMASFALSPSGDPVRTPSLTIRYSAGVRSRSPLLGFGGMPLGVASQTCRPLSIRAPAMMNSPGRPPKPGSRWRPRATTAS